MKDKAKFLEKLGALVKIGQAQSNQITIEEVENYFSQEELTDEQIELVFDYLLAQKIVVKGYVKLNGNEEQNVELTEDEKAYLDEYLTDLKTFEDKKVDKQKLYQDIVAGQESAKELLIQISLAKVVEIAKELYNPEMFIGDLIQEGNLGLVLGVNMITDVASADETITHQIKQSMLNFLEEQSVSTQHDKEMVDKVQKLDESITALTEEMGRKVTIDELAVFMGMEIGEIEDIFKLAGEELDEEKE